MKRFRNIIAKLLVISFIVTNTPAYFPQTAFAAKTGAVTANAGVKTNNTTVVEHQEKTEILVKYKDGDKQATTTENNMQANTSVENSINSNDSENNSISENSATENKVKSKLTKKLKLKKFKTKKKYFKSKINLVEIDKKDDINKVVAELKKDPDVLFVQPNYKLEVMAAPADSMFQNQWGLLNNGQETEGQLGRSGVDINAVNAWNLNQGANVVIGLLDTGVDIKHNDLKNNIYVNAGEIPDNGIDDDKNGYIDDVNGWDFVHSDNTVYDDATLDFHGTHTAGILAGEANSDGISGTAPKAKILPLKFINGNWGYTCDAIDAIEYAMKMGVKIMNCSFGGTDDNFALKDTMVNSGILFICAAGNRGADADVSPVYPACFDIPNVLSVASIDSKGVLSPYSGYGSKIQVAAPGVNILSTTPGNAYDYFTGTSAAVPFVTGTAALLKSYLPNLSITQISQRIKDNVVPCTNLSGKVSSGGRVDAYAALTNTKPAADTYTGPGNDNSTVPGGQQGGNIDTWYTMDQLAKIKEKLHYGESGVNPASGNFSFTVNDMSVPAPGFQVNMARTYNSRSDKNTPFGRGWTFGFEGYVEGTNVVDVTLPNGSVERFRLINNVYEPEETRSKFVRNADGTYTLTTKDQYKYHFNTNRYLVKMEDRNGNIVNIAVDSTGKITKITDTVGREYKINYNTSNLIDNIVDPENRTVKYDYDSINRLSVVTDPMGGKMRYFYDSWRYLNEIRDNDLKLVEKITYNHAEGENQHKVSEATDSLGDTVKYAYDMTNKKTTVTDINGRVSTYWFDTSFYTIQEQDPEGKSSYTEYYQYNGKNTYGDIKSTTDRNGNKTQYEIDKLGNVTRVTNPNGSMKTTEYDYKNNITKEVDESDNTTYYIYDSNKTNLIKKVQPVNGKDAYTGIDSDNFAITSYQYYTGAESGSSAKSLLKSETDPEGNTTTYTYNQYGDTKTVTDPEGKATNYEYNKISWKTAETTPKGNRTEYSYDRNGQLIKTTTVSDKNETTRVVYDLMGRKLQEISPNQYDGTRDNLTADTYSDSTAGTRYEYYDSGKIKSVTDALGSKTSYTYDVYGNTLTETKPNGSIYRYEYDVLDRLRKTYFRNDTSAAENLLMEYTYAIMEDHKTQQTETKYLNETDKAITVYIYDYADRVLEQQNPDGTKTKTAYNANGTIDKQTALNGSTTYYKYDGLNRLVEQWSPFEVANGNTQYSYKKMDYDRAGRKTAEKAGKDKVELWMASMNPAIKNYSYYKDGNVKAVTDSEGRKTEYSYDDDGNLEKESVYTAANNALVTEYTYNYLGKVSVKKQHANAGDIYGNAVESNTDTVLTTAYTYDKNGNTKTVTTPDNVTTAYTYDALDRQLSVSQPGLNEKGAAVTITSSTTYDWEGKPLTQTDPKGNVTAYEYDQKGNLLKTTDAKKGVALKSYDLAGRLLAEVSPKNYDSAKSITDMNRVEYDYDVMDRVIAKRDIYLDANSKQWVTLNTKTYKYDNSGNKIKELDALGYDNGSGSTPEERINSGYGTEFRYNLANMPEASIDAVTKERELPYTVKYQYDGLGRKVSETNASGVITGYTYNDAGNILSTSVRKNENSSAQVIQRNTYDLAGRALTQTDGNGNTTTFEYNALGKVRKTVYPGDSTIPANTVINQYDLMGNLKLQQASTGKINLFTYDNQGRQLSATEKKSDDTQGIAISAQYDVNGNKCAEVDGNGNTKTSTYDELNRLKTSGITVNGVHKTTTYDYDKNGNRTTVTDWLGNTNTSIYDPLDRIIEKQDAYATIQKLEYNKNSKQMKSIDALGNTTQYIYDKNDRLIATLDPEGHTTSQSYDDSGNITAKTDGRSITTTYKFDEFNRLLQVINPKSEVTSYTYDLNGNKLTQTDGNGNTTAYEYNAADKMTKRIEQGGRLGNPGRYTYLNAKVERYTYFADGNLESKTDRNGKLTGYIYDIHGRLASKAIGSNVITYTYDKNGNQLTITDSTGTTERTYDEQNRVLSKTVPRFGTTAFTYDQAEGGGLYSETTTDYKNNSTKKVYDKAGRLYKVTAGGKTTTYEYNNDGSRKSVTYADGAKEEYTYYADGLNRTVVNKKADGGVIDSYSYTYDGAHNQTSKTDAKGVTSYEYDSLNRLEKVTEPNGRSTGYTFDKAGNRLTETVLTGAVSVATTYTYNEQNRLVSTVKQSGSETEKYGFDNNGNTISKTKETVKPVDRNVTGKFNLSKAGNSITNEVTYYQYDVWNQLSKTTTGDKKITYSYNGEGYRVAKTENGQKTNYLYEADRVILETDGSGNETAKNVYGINLLTRTSGSDTMNYMYNGHGDVTALLGTDGTIKGTYYYDAFGNIVEQTGNVNNDITYAGYQYDKETDLYYLNARYYDSKIARFISEDTYTGEANDPLSLNLYTYCHNEPVMYTDPDGDREIVGSSNNGKLITVVPGSKKVNYGNTTSSNYNTIKKEVTKSNAETSKRQAANAAAASKKAQEQAERAAVQAQKNKNANYSTKAKEASKNATNLEAKRKSAEKTAKNDEKKSVAAGNKPTNNTKSTGSTSTATAKGAGNSKTTSKGNDLTFGKRLEKDNYTADAFYGKVSGPSLTYGSYHIGVNENGSDNKAKGLEVKLGSGEVGLVKITGDYEYAEWNLSCVKANADAKVGTSGLGFNAKASLAEAGTVLKIPIPYSDNKLVIGGSGDIGSVGGGIKVDEKGITFGFHFIIGYDIKVGVK